MSSSNPAIEACKQQMPHYSPELRDLAPSEPLGDMQQSQFNLLHTTWSTEEVTYQYSNDEATLALAGARGRIFTPGYRKATNRTALIVGEGSLAAALAHDMLPEDNIVLLDDSRTKINFMRDYADSLKVVRSLTDWHTVMRTNQNKPRSARLLDEQIERWDASGYTHPLADETAFKKAQQVARTKTFVPWHADLGSKKDLSRLQGMLAKHNATITMANLTNVVPYEDNRIGSYREVADRLAVLPFTPDAPILTTSLYGHPHNHTREVMATGPFFGLHNLREHGDSQEATRHEHALRANATPDDPEAFLATLPPFIRILLGDMQASSSAPEGDNPMSIRVVRLGGTAMQISFEPESTTPPDAPDENKPT